MASFQTCPACKSVFVGDVCPTCRAKPEPKPARSPLRLGSVFHGYLILELLGRGGMGVVYKASRSDRDGFIALKLLPPDRSFRPDFGGRFEREAAVLAALAHPNIVKFVEFGREGAIYFIAMELLEGNTLRQVLDRGRPDTPVIHSVLLQLCDALSYAHAQGVVHRDVKPENILLDPRGRAKLADFGLAKLIIGDASLDLTQSGAAIGTSCYMAPEQARDARDVDPRADLYSVGMVLQEMLADRSSLEWDTVVAKACARDREARYPTAAALKRDLERLSTKP